MCAAHKQPLEWVGTTFSFMGAFGILTTALLFPCPHCPQLLVKDVALEAAHAADAQSCGAELLGPGVGSPPEGAPLRLRRGDVVSVLFPLRCSTEGSAQLLGTLRLRWQRGEQEGREEATARLALPLGVCIGVTWCGVCGALVCACEVYGV